MLSLEVSKRSTGWTRSPQDGDDRLVPADPGIGVVPEMRHLDAAHPGLGGAVAGLEVEDVVVGLDEARPGNEVIGDRAQRLTSRPREDVLDDDEAVPAIGIHLTGRKLPHPFSLQ